MGFRAKTEIVSVGFGNAVTDRIEVFRNRNGGNHPDVCGKIGVHLVQKNQGFLQGRSVQNQLGSKIHSRYTGICPPGPQELYGPSGKNEPQGLPYHALNGFGPGLFLPTLKTKAQKTEVQQIIVFPRFGHWK